MRILIFLIYALLIHAFIDVIFFVLFCLVSGLLPNKFCCLSRDMASPREVLGTFR